MSQKGIKLAAKVFEAMQEARGELLRLGSSAPDTREGHQDILLGQLLRDANDAVKDQFALLVDINNIHQPKPKRKRHV